MKRPPSNAIDTGKPIFDDYYDKSWEKHTKLTTVFYEYHERRKVVGYVTVSMSKIHTEIDNQTLNFPSLLLGMLGVDKNYTREGRGTELILFVIGLASKLSKQVGCRLVILEILDLKCEDNTYTEDARLICFYKELGFKVARADKRNRKVLYFDLKVK